MKIELTPTEFHDLMRALTLVSLDYETRKKLGAEVVNLLVSPPKIDHPSEGGRA